EASAAAEPPPEPPGVGAGSHGLRVGPYAEFCGGEPIAISSMLVFPRRGVRASRRLAVPVAACGDRYPSIIREAHVVGASVVVNTSLRAIGTPASGPTSSPAAIRASTARADSSARSAPTCRKALISPSTSAIRSRCARVTSSAETSREAIRAASVAAVAVVSSLMSVLPEDLRDLEALLIRGRGLVERLLRAQARGHHIG